jgi:hypothetical protein
MSLNTVKYAVQDTHLESSIHQVQNATYAAQRGTSWMVLTHAFVGKMDAGQVTACVFVSTPALSPTIKSWIQFSEIPVHGMFFQCKKFLIVSISASRVPKL